MNSKLVIANICRTVARVISIPLVPIAVLYLLFIGLQIPSEGGNVTGFILFTIILLAMLLGLIIAWWREALGSSLALIAAAGFFLTAGFLGSWETVGDASPLAGPLHLIFALTMPGYHPDVSPISRWVPLISWILLIAPALLFLVSWSLRRNPRPKN